MRAQKYQPDESLGRGESLNTRWHVPDAKQNMGQPPVALILAETCPFSWSLEDVVQALEGELSKIQTEV